MAFFDNLTKAVSEATQSVTQKGKDLADIAKLNYAVSEEEKKLEDAYKRIGKMFVDKIGDRAEGPFAQIVNEINESQKKIADYKKQVRDLKGIVCCQKCGAELAAGAVFCNVCGERVPQPQPPQAPQGGTRCTNCGAALASNTQFCTSCGHKVEAQAPQQPQQEQPQATQQEQPQEQPQANICPNCKAQIAPGAAFCTSCGAKLN